tara:strand:+ start:499 stop:1737 length:1239 start_codon:yes stop_codon:yes gene_type:complete
MSYRTPNKEYQKVCPCGKSFKAKGANAIYCSQSCCSHFSYIRRKPTAPVWEPKELSCALESCGKKFTQKSRNQKYCSKDCSHIKNHGSLPIGEIEKVCVTCENTFKTKAHNQKYCQISCQPSYSPVVPQGELKERKCELEECDNKFTPPTSSPNKKFCCKEHASQHHKKLYRLNLKPKVTKTFTCEWCRETFEKTGYEANLKQVKFCSTKCNVKSLQAKSKSVTNHSPKIALTKKGKVNNQGDVKLGLPDYRFGDSTFCTYCGDSLIGVQSDVDHCIPQSFFLDVGVPHSNARGLTCPSCHKCNSLLYNKIFDTFKQRREYLTDKYQTVIDRYFNEENTWTEEELDEHDYDYVLRKFIEQKIWNRYVLLDKVNWPFSAEYGGIIEAVEFDIKYTEEFNEAQLPFMKRFFEIK